MKSVNLFINKTSFFLNGSIDSNYFGPLIKSDSYKRNLDYIS